MFLSLLNVYLPPVHLCERGTFPPNLSVSVSLSIPHDLSLPAPIGVVDQSLTKDFPGPAGEVSAYGPGAVSTAMVQDGDGRKDLRSPAKAPHVQFVEGKVW